MIQHVTDREAVRNRQEVSRKPQSHAEARGKALGKCRAGAGFFSVRMQIIADIYRQDAKCFIKYMPFVILRSDFALALPLMATCRSTSPSRANSGVCYVGT